MPELKVFFLFDVFPYLRENYVESNDGGSEDKWNTPGEQGKTEKPEKEKVFFLQIFLRFKIKKVNLRKGGF